MYSTKVKKGACFGFDDGGGYNSGHQLFSQSKKNNCENMDEVTTLLEHSPQLKDVHHHDSKTFHHQQNQYDHLHKITPAAGPSIPDRVATILEKPEKNWKPGK